MVGLEIGVEGGRRPARGHWPATGPDTRRWRGP
jgi:hypothetical protein